MGSDELSLPGLPVGGKRPSKVLLTDMGKKQSKQDEPHGIRLPGSILDQIKDTNGDDDRFQFGKDSYNKKRKAPVSRRDQRKQERQVKKQKKAENTRQKKIEARSQDKKKSKKSKKPEQSTQAESSDEEEMKALPEDDELSEGDFDDFGSDDEFGDEDDEDQPQTAEDTMAALMALKAKKNKSNGTSESSAASKKSDNKKAVVEESEDDDFNGFSDESFTDDEEDQPQTAEETMAALMALKAKKNQAKETKPKNSVKKVGESEDEDDFEDFDDFSDESFTDDEEDQPQTAEDVFAALKAAKEKKMKASQKSEKELKKEKKEKEKADKKREKEAKKKEKAQREREEAKAARSRLTDEQLAQMKKDERDIKYYAKKLGLKSTKVKDFKKMGMDDGLDDLFDGLDFLDEYDDVEANSGGYDDLFNEQGIPEDEIAGASGDDEEGGDQDDDDEEVVENPFSSDDEINSSDFDSDIGPEDLEDDDEEQGDVIMAGPKENPYVAPVAKKYVPPALRARLQATDSELELKIKRTIKGALNKLSEANVMTMVNQVNAVFLENPRQVVTECLTSVILESIVQQSTLLDTFVTLHAALMTALYRLQGVDVGAHFIQTLVEKYEEFFKQEQGKECGNLLSLLTACYSFQLVSCKLLYNIIGTLITNVSEMNTDLLLRIVRNVGPQMRSDDPNALKEIILQFQQNIQGVEMNARTRFLSETITNLKNNKNKTVNENTAQLVTRMRKVLATINNKMSDPLQVSLEDIHNVATKGKWWLVGASWRGNMAGEKSVEDVVVDKEEMNEILDSAEPNWMELARAQRMNTDIRKAIFVSIMSSQDYIEAFTKLDKLRLKRSQEREIPKILLHCVSIEKVYNPYYGLLANKLCTQHSLRKTFQFCFWDLLTELEGDDADSDEEGEGDYFKKLNADLVGEDDDFQLQRSVNLGKFFGVMVAEGTLPLHSLKNLNFLSLNQDIGLFLEVMLISFFDGIGKKSEIATFGLSSKKSKKAEDLRFDDKLLLERIAKCQEQKVLLRGLQYFLQERVRGSDIISGRKQRKRVEWGVDTTCDVADELLKSTY